MLRLHLAQCSRILPAVKAPPSLSLASLKRGTRFFSSQVDPKAARREKLKSKSSNWTVPLLGTLGVTGLIGYAVYDIKENPNGVLASYYKGSSIQHLIDTVYARFFQEIFEPNSDKLLPDWGSPFYGNVPPGSVPPPLLVVDLEKTLIGSEYDVKHGWRHVKRPGLDKFIRDLSNYYEIVIFSENDIGTTQEILMHIDPEGRCHKFGSSAAEIKGTSVIKRLDYMNRDLSRIILIDDDPVSAQLFPRNTLFVKPFDNVQNKSDSVLYDLVPLLQAFVHEDCRDFRVTLDSLGTHEAEEAAIEYKMRLSRLKAQEGERRNRGLGGLIRGNKPGEFDDELLPRSSILSPSQIVGAGVPTEEIAAKIGLPVTKVKLPGEEEKPKGFKKKGGWFEKLDNYDRAKQEQERIKHEQMNQIQMQRMARLQQEQQQQ
jgi:import inner membrane translocase subunit TIM50